MALIRLTLQSTDTDIDPLLSFLKEINFSFQASEELEDRQSLAVMAASGQDEVTGPDGETFIEKYTRGVSAVETILTLDRFVFEQILVLFLHELLQYVTFHEQQECGYGFPSLPLATRASAGCVGILTHPLRSKSVWLCG